ncbi:MAG: hypothetical protein R2788_09470 [Saprospiraceae bacterium]
MRDYDVTEEKSHEIRAAINRKKEGLKGSSAYLPGKLQLLKEKGFDLNTLLNGF